jgi:hypothetical protein
LNIGAGKTDMTSSPISTPHAPSVASKSRPHHLITAFSSSHEILFPSFPSKAVYIFIPIYFRSHIWGHHRAVCSLRVRHAGSGVSRSECQLNIPISAGRAIYLLWNDLKLRYANLELAVLVLMEISDAVGGGT